MRKLTATLALTLGVAVAASAGSPPPPPPPPPNVATKVHKAPEIDPAGAIAGLTLLVGGIAVLRSRRAGKK